MLKAGLKFLVFAALIVAGWLVARSLGVGDVDAATAQAWAARQGVVAPILAVALYGLLSGLGSPGAPLTMACGFAFGTAEGAAVALVGANLGANLAFFLSRRLGRDLVARVLGEKLARVEPVLAKGGAEVVVTMRLVPFVPFVAINFASGVVPGLRWRDFALGTAIGIVPGAFAYAAAGELFDPKSPSFWALIAAIQLLAAAPIAVRAWRRRRSADAPRPGS